MRFARVLFTLVACCAAAAHLAVASDDHPLDAGARVPCAAGPSNLRPRSLLAVLSRSALLKRRRSDAAALPLYSPASVPSHASPFRPAGPDNAGDASSSDEIADLGMRAEFQRKVVRAAIPIGMQDRQGPRRGGIIRRVAAAAAFSPVPSPAGALTKRVAEGTCPALRLRWGGLRDAFNSWKHRIPVPST